MHPLPSVTGWLGLWKLSAAYRELSWPSPPTPGEKSFHMSCFFLCWARKPPGRARSATRLGSRLACRRARPRRSKHSLLPMPFPFWYHLAFYCHLVSTSAELCSVSLSSFVCRAGSSQSFTNPHGHSLRFYSDTSTRSGIYSLIISPFCPFLVSSHYENDHLSSPYPLVVDDLPSVIGTNRSSGGRFCQSRITTRQPPKKR